MTDAEAEIREMVARETRAWDTQDVDLLISFFHPDMVWPWPPSPEAHDPLDWVLDQGRFDRERWRRGWQQLFDTHRLARNERVLRKIVVSREGDGALPVVDVDTLWIDAKGRENHWKGRVGKVYTKRVDGWKLIMHTGVLRYP